MSLHICSTISALREARKRASTKGSVALVPTMGALHKGHRSLIRAAKERCHTVIVSIFVNPTQFGPAEDFTQYPRTFDADCSVLEEEGVDILFAPSVGEMYPAGASTFINAGEIASRLDGASRPGHFRGVATVVMKLFNIATPDVSFFGQKDAAQVAVLKKMVSDLNVPVQIVVCPTMRDPDGLALSSRNIYLSSEERENALALSRALNVVNSQAKGNILSATELRQTLLNELQKTPTLRIDYAEIVAPDTLLPTKNIYDGALVAVAAWVGKTRLIDNLLLPSRNEAVQ